ncbi:hypothetical protein ACCD06_03520 [Azospirillum sp. CT11-132]|jgi:hypothetical protein|uniref:hypothetical protein n=1 Tax=unclassified Azospirillum TaxID=2630922 RepID=UPI000D61877E|nr:MULTISPECIES: hypothetical protein [unclassified Azospirillum]MCM8736938.1 hypothetical protein [Azospirillum sp. A1-3]PWC66288.1 hypothetical protein TSH7_06805 [Azospirillum sp. TSH7]PWC70139.1 hypothetical protein TSH20_07565 [Azospirillum sp. TSH20]PWC95370.1 hypothetical protein TSO5_10930 [Azospirillum sp. TSO5]QCG95476.1 hypothetical protein E6C67_16655 [Azospirillum sp. TSA2s]
MNEDPAPDLRLSPAEVEAMAAEFKVSPLWVRLALLFRPANRAALVALVAWASGLPLPPT